MNTDSTSITTHPVVAPAVPAPATNYTATFSTYGGYIGFAAMFAFPSVGLLGNAIIGAISGGGGCALGSAVGMFFDTMSETPSSAESRPSAGVKPALSVVFGLLGLVAWMLPVVGFPVTIIGFVLGCKGRSSDRRSLALAGMGLSLLGLLLCTGNSYLGALMGARAALSHGP